MPRSESDPPRRRDANRTRAELLHAAGELFGQQGYGATTLRAIGERAGVDPALIARYFGNKLALYLATIEDAPPPPSSGDHVRELVERMVERTKQLGPTPIARVAVAGTEDDEVRAIVSRLIQERSVTPLRGRLEATGMDRAQLRSEVALAAAMGVVLTRAAGTMGTLTDASDEEVVEVLTAAVDAALGMSSSRADESTST